MAIHDHGTLAVVSFLQHVHANGTQQLLTS
jgi:hypothetical protein